VGWFSLGPPPAELNAFSLSDKLLHFGAYATTTGAFLLAAVWRPGRGDGAFPRTAPLLVAAAIAIAAALEVAQGTLVSDRSADILDAVAGSLGAAVALAGWAALRRAVLRSATPSTTKGVTNGR
jgi:VanZ family protein